MAPITRLALVATLVCSAFVNAAPVFAPAPADAPAPALMGAPVAVGGEEGHALFKRAPAATVITRCTLPGTVAITFDDGPHIYTKGLLDNLRKKNAKVTFFINGENFGPLTQHSSVLKQMLADGHQIASHTWSHQDLATLKGAAIIQEMTKLEVALRAIIGKAPTFMRPPYGSTNALALTTLGNLGYKVINWDQDTNDWQHTKDYKKSLDLYKTVLKKSSELKKPGHIFLQHDVHELTAKKVGPLAVDYALSKGYKVVTVGTCLGIPESAWYKN
ncbi:hypothetical protein BCR41DRAFT_345166 [Lobosporangium transversale]|uniref:NodB homology domain-containing protein n=1 Tax=Lobosporangium transversale TaxID=64571 RepID=A0A1Y2H1E6_9FUNG|nr:hypothetical protein BCR41DRAFT_345166 [Lobosporangium transversale]ORZ28356.1 hypothetical protein BCR41DRAFT_345166 [Lobosporangium transversale]|eukprot:XP_021886041.1 hypothetical protein BCR41DRAFT_345166 [Lobosporangium transversale]